MHFCKAFDFLQNLAKSKEKSKNLKNEEELHNVSFVYLQT